MEVFKILRGFEVTEEVKFPKKDGSYKRA